VGGGPHEGKSIPSGGSVTLTGNRCRCAAWGEHFNSVSVFDRHCAGEWQERGTRRRCLSVPEMQARNWSQNATGFWTERAFGNARERLDRTRRSGDRPLEPHEAPIPTSHLEGGASSAMT
jgi:hypothetical protein